MALCTYSRLSRCRWRLSLSRQRFQLSFKQTGMHAINSCFFMYMVAALKEKRHPKRKKATSILMSKTCRLNNIAMRINTIRVRHIINRIVHCALRIAHLTLRIAHLALHILQCALW